MKILYIYSGSRKGKQKGEIHVDYPDTQFYGLNHFADFGVSAVYKEPEDIPAGFLLKRLFGFRVAHFLMYFIVKKYDVVFGSSILYMMIWKKFIKTKTQFVLFNIGFIRTIEANKNRKLKIWVIKWLLREVRVVVCLSNTQMEYLRKNIPFLRDKLFLVHFGIDEKFYKPVYEGRRKYILSVGRDNGRDYETIIHVAEKMPDKEFHFVCSKRNIRTKNIPSNIKIFYDLDLKDVVVKYSEASILLLITHDDKHSDGSDCSGQTVLLEALASGLPVVVSRKKYLNDYIQDKKHALFVDFYSPDSIINAIKEFNNEKVRLSIAQNARKLIENKFTTKKMAGELLEIFKNI